jgi:hypothetical protein
VVKPSFYSSIHNFIKRHALKNYAPWPTFLVTTEHLQSWMLLSRIISTFKKEEKKLIGVPLALFISRESLERLER